MLTIVLTDALRGEPIDKRYPQFFAQIEANPHLCRAFLEALDLLEQAAQDQLPPLPIPPSRDLSFLTETPPGHTLDQPASGRFRAAWTQAAAALQAVLFPPALFESPAYRADFDYLEPASFTLLHSETQVAGQTLSVLLEASQPLEAPDTLRLNLTAAFAAGAENPPPLRAVLTWGAYHAAAPLDPQGRAAFPPLPLAAVLDAQSENVHADLLLALEPAA